MAAQSPPILVFPDAGTCHLPLNEQAEKLIEEYGKYNSYRGSASLNKNMARNIKRAEPVERKGKGKKYGNGLARIKLESKDTELELENVKTVAEDKESPHVIARDNARFIEQRISEDVMILGKVLERMIIKTAKMEHFVERQLREAGVTEMPNWREMFPFNPIYAMNKTQPVPEQEMKMKGKRRRAED